MLSHQLSQTMLGRSSMASKPLHSRASSRNKNAPFAMAPAAYYQPSLIEVIDSSDDESSEPDWEDFSLGTRDTRFMLRSSSTLGEEDQKSSDPTGNEPSSGLQSSIWAGLQNSSNFLADHLFGATCAMHGASIHQSSETSRTSESKEISLWNVIDQNGIRKRTLRVTDTTVASPTTSTTTIARQVQNHDVPTTVDLNGTVPGVSNHRKPRSTKIRNNSHEYPDSVMEKLRRFACVVKASDGDPGSRIVSATWGSNRLFRNTSIKKSDGAIQTVCGYDSFDDESDWSPSDDENETPTPMLYNNLRPVNGESFGFPDQAKKASRFVQRMPMRKSRSSRQSSYRANNERRQNNKM